MTTRTKEILSMTYLFVIKQNPFTILLNVTDVVSMVRVLTNMAYDSDKGINACDRAVKDRVSMYKVNLDRRH